MEDTCEFKEKDNVNFYSVGYCNNYFTFNSTSWVTHFQTIKEIVDEKRDQGLTSICLQQYKGFLKVYKKISPGEDNCASGSLGNTNERSVIVRELKVSKQTVPCEKELLVTFDFDYRGEAGLPSVILLSVLLLPDGNFKLFSSVSLL